MQNAEDIKAAIVIIYFGALPKYFDLWRHTAQLNNQIHFHVIGDSVQTSRDKNISYHALSIDEFNSLTLMKTEGLELRSAYKICDFKPLIAELFPELISGYRYWGFGDFDVLYGDILSVVGDSFGKFDYVSTGWEGESGPLAFLVNSEKVNTLWRSISSIHSKLNNPECTGIDEHEFLDALKQKCSCDIIFRECLYDLPAQWREGKLLSLRHEREYALYHFGGTGLQKPKSRIIKKASKLIEHIRRGGAIRIGRRNNLIRSGLISMIVSRWTERLTGEN
jgi:hypothetical protein